MGMDQDTVYLKGLYVDLPESWIKGVKKDDKIVIEQKAADGAYCFGIHAVSDADNNGLYLQSIKVEEKEVTNGIESIVAPTLNAVKFVEKGQFYLLRNGIRYNASGAKLE